MSQESRLSQGGLQGNSLVLGSYTMEQPEANRTIEARGCLVRSLVRSLVRRLVRLIVMILNEG